MESLKEKEEKKIPVLAVEKNGVIVKNIILNSPVYKSESEQEQSENSEKSSQKEEKLLVGRHPDCHIVLDHPSVSRFHLQIQFETSSQKLYITDLSSVHGTWVSGQKIEPRIPVELQEGNTLRIGASTRVYRLQWFPLKWAFQIDSPQMSTVQEDQEDYQDNNSISSLWPKQKPSAPPLLEREENHSPPRRSKQRGSSSIWSRRGKPLGSLRIQTGRTEEKIAVNFAVDAEARNCEETMNLEQGKTQNGFQDPFSEVLCADLGMEADVFPSDKDNLIPNIQLSLKSEKKPENGNLRVESSRLGLQGQFSEVLHINSPMDEEVFCSDKENSLPLGLKSRKRPENGNSIVKASRLGLLGSPSEVFLSHLAAEEEKFSSDKENSMPKTSIGLQSKKKSVYGNLKMVEPLKIQRSYSKVLFSNSEMVEEGFSSDKENLTPRISLGPKSNKKSAREKLTMEAESFSAAIQQQEQEVVQNEFESSCSKVLFSNSEIAEDGFSSDKENVTQIIPFGMKSNKESVCGNSNMEANIFSTAGPEHRKQDAMKPEFQSSCSKVLFPNSEMVEDGFSSDKENLTQKILLRLKSNKKSVSGNSKKEAKITQPELQEQEVTQKEFQSSCSKVLFSNSEIAEDGFSSDKENVTQIIPFGMKSNKESVCGNSNMEANIFSTAGPEHRKQDAMKPEFQSSCSEVLFPNSEMVEDGFSSDKENLTQKILLGLKSNKKSVSGNSKKEAKITQPELQEQEVTQKEFQSSCSKVLFSNSEIAEDGFSSDKENVMQIIPFGMKSNKESVCGNSNMEANIFTTGPEHRKQEAMKLEFQSSCSKVLFPNSEMVEDGFSSDKENLTPKIPLGLKLNKKSVSGNSKKEAKITQPELQGVFLSNLDVDESIFPSDKENLTPHISNDLKSNKKLTTDYPAKSRHELKISRRVAERAPFQVLLTNSPCNNSKAVLTATSRNSNSITTSRKRTPSAEQSVDQTFQKAREAKKLWNMVVDTSCFLNEESRRSLKLLEGLRGTHLIIPRMVIRELDSLKRPGSRFRKPNVASLILQWIEECMVKTKWWIHVQNSAESLPIAETPPASPSQRLSEGSNEFAGSIPFSTHGSFLQLVTPTAEDHILECALLFKKIKTDGHLVLLTNDVALKIKAMAEGLICETPKEFCESLVNPYSERFLWMESTPRGPTWSSLDFQCSIRITEKCGAHEEDAVRRRAAEGAKGLKLILLHNSHYGHQINSVK